MLDKNITIDQAIFELGMTMDQRTGQSRGLISLLTRGITSRQDIIEQSLKMALVSALNRRDYR